jgi:lipopolysaccharide transport system ATP-binding protein
MSDLAIRVENLGKMYRIGVADAQPDTRWQALKRLAASPFGYLQRMMRPPTEAETLWALHNVSFEVERGEVLGVIGRNGAGKSTLLKILSRITEPTEGQAEIHGRVGSLLEVGTGFHPELTGRENIYLNGAILGMKREEIDRKFDEIVAFAEMERFLDTPVKRYSSGMYVRLAFAVAAHLEPEILLVDEVLAVGDAGFQKRSIGKMSQVAAEGRTVLVVSHNMGIIESMCTRALLLENGALRCTGSASTVVDSYLRGNSEANSFQVDLQQHENRLPGMVSALQFARISTLDATATDSFLQGDPVCLEITYDASALCDALAGAGFILTSAQGARVGGYNTYMAFPPPHQIPLKGKIRFTIDAPRLTPGVYFLTISLGTHQNHLLDKVENMLSFTVFPRDIYGTGYLLTPEDGVVAMDCTVSIADH